MKTKLHKSITKKSRQQALQIILLLLFTHAQLFAATYTVSNTNDAGAGSLRQAITDANANVGADVIIFTVAGTVTLVTALPALTDNAGVTIDGSTAPGYAANTNPTGGLNGTLVFTIDGSNAFTTGITISSDNNIIRGLNFINVGFAFGSPETMVEITAGADNNSILGCYIGTDISGVGAAGIKAEYGVRISDGANNKIGDGTASGRNLISGLGNPISSSGAGVYIQGGAAIGNTIRGNIIGLQKDGASNTTGNKQDFGIDIRSSSSGNTIGGTAAVEGNVISGNLAAGISLFNVSGNSILGNIIGLQHNGITSAGILSTGIAITGSSNNIIGGSTSGARNIISGNGSGVILTYSNNNTIIGNYIGTDKNGTSFISGSSQSRGIFISCSSNNIIGGTVAGEGNVISGNTNYGIYMIGNCANPNPTNNNVILGNIIGPQTNGTSSLLSVTDNQDYGVHLFQSQYAMEGNNIGGSVLGAGNTIAYHEREGVWMYGTNSSGDFLYKNLISRNSFFCNSQTSGIAGILLDGNNFAFIANQNMPAPVITSVTATLISGTAVANATIEVFYNDAPCNRCATGQIEGQTYIGTTTADGAGNWSLTGSFANGSITATATDVDNNTSQFSNCVPAPLPIELLSFTARAENTASSDDHVRVRCDWTTVTEINNDYFAVLRSKDGINFEQIGTVQGAGNSNAILQYVFYDEHPYSGLSYYRLKQFDFDGTYSYSNIEAVYIGEPSIINVFPNPSQEDVHVVIGTPDDMEVEIVVFNGIGQAVSKRSDKIDKGYTTLTIDISSYAQGIYLFKVTTPDGTHLSKEFIKR